MSEPRLTVVRDKNDQRLGVYVEGSVVFERSFAELPGSLYDLVHVIIHYTGGWCDVGEVEAEIGKNGRLPDYVEDEHGN